MIDQITSVFWESLQITGLVLLMMISVDIINVWTRGKLGSILHSTSKWKQYIISSAIGTTPGCVGAFANVSLYMHGMIGFGAVAGSMLATSGDEAFVMLALFPKTAIILFGILFLLGIFAGKITDFIVRKFKIKTCTDCDVPQYHSHHEKDYKHYIQEHVWNHIIKKHIWKTFLWTFGALLLLDVGLAHWHIHELAGKYTLLLLFAGALIGLIPESGPNLIFVTMFAGGFIPFSVLLTNSMVQDGHGLLPMLSYSLRDSMMIKAFNLVIGLSLGLILFYIGF